MMGWNIRVYRQMNKRTTPATTNSSQGTRLAVWQTDSFGLGWIDELVKEGKAVDLGGDGYPSHYTATFEHLIPPILLGPPQARSAWAYDATDILGKLWEGKTVINQPAVKSCRPGEWLLIEAWDES